MPHWQRENGDWIVFRPNGREFLAEVGDLQFSLHEMGGAWVLRFSGAFAGGSIRHWDAFPETQVLREAVEGFLSRPNRLNERIDVDR